MQDVSGADVLGALAAIVGPDHVVTDATERAYVSQDYFRAAAQPVAAVVRPGSTKELSAVVAAATRAGVAIYPRGAGYSYTDAYLPTRHPALTIDMSRMARIVEINATDMYATVEAGCPWGTLDQALAPLGLRVPMWGPLSGRTATVGGGVSQGCVSLGSSKYGTSADSVLGMDVVAADGTVVRTGTAAQAKHAPFFRPYGPDLTGLFCADAGALGVKATVTLRLMARPRHIAGASFAFDDFDRTVQGMAAAARLGVASESLGMSIAALRAAAASAGLLQDLKTLLTIVRSAANP
ncbi:MAG: FAD-binding oxidoreductase, partial [Rhodospirillaceae bacterium]|nr:FAD-binding oxidoreductase [Rhodospirillaceae bacterium]